MKFNFLETIKDLDGGVVSNSDAGKPYTLQTTCQTALLAQVDPMMKDAAEKARRFDIAVRISNNPASCTLMPEEVAEIKKAVGQLYGPLFVGRVKEMLEDGGALVNSAAGEFLHDAKAS